MTITTLSDAQTIHAAVFGAGVILQSFLVLGKNVLTLKYWFGYVVGFLGFLPGRKERNYSVGLHLLLYIGAFAIYQGATFRKHIQPLISERTLLQLSIISLYASFIAQADWVKVLFGMLSCLVIPIVFYSTFSSSILKKEIKVYSYIWFLVITIALIIFQSNLDVGFFINQNYDVANNLETYIKHFLTGMITFPLVINAFYLYELIPLKGKRETWEHRMREIKLRIKEMNSNFTDYQISLKEAFVIVFLQGGFLLANYYFQTFDNLLAITISIFFVEVITYFRFDYWKMLNIALGIAIKSNHSKIS